MPNINGQHYRAANYLVKAFDRRRMSTHLGALATRAAKKWKDPAPDAVFFTGLSGALVGIRFSELMDINPGAIRKPSDESHGGDRYQGPGEVHNYIIIDDIVATGNTMRNIRQEVRRQHPSAVLLGIVLWGEDCLEVHLDGAEDPIPCVSLSWQERYEIWGEDSA